MEVVICAIAKYENIYIREWVDYHLNIGFTKIFIHDNNDLDEEQICDVINKDIYRDKVEVIDVRGLKYVQKKVYNIFFKSYKFDWCAFIDIDEFITFTDKSKYKDIRKFLADKQEFDAVHLNWMCHGDNGKTKASLLGVIQRFGKPVSPRDFKYNYLFPENNHIKSIIRYGIDINWEHDDDAWTSNPHTPFGLKQISNGSGTKKNENTPFQPYDFEIVYIRHYFTKTIEEYAIKIKRQCADCNADFYNFSKFYRVNKLTPIKILIQNKIDDSKIMKNTIKQCFHEFLKFYICINRFPFLSFLFKSLRK